MLETLVRGIIPQDDEQRLEALHSFEILYTSAESAFDNITQMMAQVFKAPMAFISLVDKETVFYKSKVGPFDSEAVRREDSLCSLTILGTEPLVIEDASGEVCFQDNPYVSSTGGIRFYAGAPLTTKEGFQIGTACIVDTIPRSFSENDKSLLVRFASLVMHEVEMRRGALFQIQTAQDIVRKNKQLQSLSHQLKCDKERFDLVAKATQDAIWDWDVLTDEIWWNEGFKELFGYRDEEIELSTFTWTGRIHPDDKERVVNGIHHAIENGGKNWSCEYRFRKADGSYAIVFDRGYALHNENGQPYRMLGSMQDVTERKKSTEFLEQKIDERTRELRQLNDQLRQFTYAASHDLQEPLRKISFFLNRLLSSIGPGLSDENKGIAERIESTASRMRSLIDDLLAYSNTTLGITSFKEVGLTGIVREVLEDMEATIIQKCAIIDLQELPHVKGDARQLRQMFQNLISNSLKYQKADASPQVQIASKLVMGGQIEAIIPQEQQNVRFHQIRIRDNGIGFHADDAERIFRLFQRLHGKAEFPGTGVGLAIVQKVVENHQGFIWAEGRLGEGAMFNVLLPAE